MFATGSATCPVTIFKEFLSRRPPEIRPTGPLYLSCMSNHGILASLVQATADGNEQAQRHDEGFNKKKKRPRRIHGKPFQPQYQENSSKEAENSRPSAKFNRKSNGPPKREVTG